MRTWRKKHQRVYYHRIDVEALPVDTSLPFDLFIKIADKMTVFRQTGALIDSRHRQVLNAPQIEGVYISSSSLPQYQEHMELSLGTFLTSEHLTLRRKVETFYRTAAGLLDAVFAEPPGVPLIERSARMAEYVVSLLMADAGAVGEFLTITASDYATPAHSANVCFLAVALAQRAGIEDRRGLEDLALGALLHDVGQTRISKRILRKRGALTTAEYDLIKKAPWWGVDILAQSGVVREDAFIPVLQHQERMDGTGYPVGLRGSDVHLYGRICGIVEAYDAITSKHVYREAQESFPALVTMMGESEKFDTALLETFIRLLRKQKEPRAAAAAQIISPA